METAAPCRAAFNNILAHLNELSQRTAGIVAEAGESRKKRQALELNAEATQGSHSNPVLAMGWFYAKCDTVDVCRCQLHILPQFFPSNVFVRLGSTSRPWSSAALLPILVTAFRSCGWAFFLTR
jgi:hypothetical protein